MQILDFCIPRANFQLPAKLEATTSAEFLSLSNTVIWGQVILSCGGRGRGPGTVSVSLASAH